MRCTVLAVCFAALTACTSEAPCPAAHVQEIAPGVFVREGDHAPLFEASDIATVGFVIGERSVAVIDSGGSPAEGRALLCAIRQQTELAITHVINTHVHPDHVFGNRAFIEHNPDVQIVGHRNLTRATGLRSASYVQNANAVRPTPWEVEDVVVPPTIAVDEELAIDLGGRTLLVRAHRTAHTDADLSVWDAETRTRFTGDLLFIGHLPALDGSINGWIDVLERWAAEAPPAHVVPGHGPATGPATEALAANLAYLTAVRKAVRAAVAAGDSLEEAQASAAAQALADWVLVEEYHERNVAAAFVELEWE
ncbi:MAG: quinoprotein relay system zinc metallohydrolase 2 [Pseudomonadota bacterium]